jgi:ribosomal protein L32E
LGNQGRGSLRLRPSLCALAVQPPIDETPPDQNARTYLHHSRLLQLRTGSKRGSAYIHEHERLARLEDVSDLHQPAGAINSMRRHSAKLEVTDTPDFRHPKHHFPVSWFWSQPQIVFRNIEGVAQPIGPQGSQQLIVFRPSQLRAVADHETIVGVCQGALHAYYAGLRRLELTTESEPQTLRGTPHRPWNQIRYFRHSIAREWPFCPQEFAEIGRFIRPL